MHIVVLSAIEAGSQWAYAVNTVKMAEGFARLGHRVTYLGRSLPGRRPTPRELEASYGISTAFEWRLVPPTVLGWPLDNHWHAAAQMAPTLLRLKPDAVYSRNYILPWLAARLGFPTIAESHAHPDNRTPPFLRMIGAAALPNLRLLVTISERLAQPYAELGVPRAKLAVLPDAVDLTLFERPAGALPPDPYGGRRRPVVAYTGHLHDYKGIPTILDAAGRMPGAEFHLVGGWPEDVERHRRTAADRHLDNVVFHGLIPHAAIPAWLWHADVLLLPPSARHHSAAWTSPMKLGEYLASGTPVVASAIPALMDWLDEREVSFFRPDDAEDLVRAIGQALDGNPERRRLAIETARGWSFDGRARRMLARAGIAG